MFRESFTALKGDYVECLTTSKLSLESEDEKTTKIARKTIHG